MLCSQLSAAHESQPGYRGELTLEKPFLVVLLLFNGSSGQAGLQLDVYSPSTVTFTAATRTHPASCLALRLCQHLWKEQENEHMLPFSPPVYSPYAFGCVHP